MEKQIQEQLGNKVIDEIVYGAVSATASSRTGNSVDISGASSALVPKPEVAAASKPSLSRTQPAHGRTRLFGD